jgi:hypothetical protein
LTAAIEEYIEAAKPFPELTCEADYVELLDTMKKLRES